MRTDRVRLELIRFAQKIERRTLAIVAGDVGTAALEQAEMELAADLTVDAIDEAIQEAYGG